MDYSALLALIVQAIELGAAAVPQLVEAYRQLQEDLSGQNFDWPTFDARVTAALGSDAWKIKT